MNYALDALWWKLKNPIVRDLASLLTAPAPWINAHELPIAKLLGEHGFRYLLHLDNQPQSLMTFIDQSESSNRLGRYAEVLLAFWFSHATHAKLIATNLVIINDKKTRGALDFLVQLNQELFHIELTCKYYGAENLALNALQGLNSQDKLHNKISKIEQQLQLSNKIHLDRLLENNQLPCHQLKRASIIRGILFTKLTTQDPEQPINCLSWQGFFIQDWKAKTSAVFLRQFDEKSIRWIKLNRLEYLAPARVSEEKTHALSQLLQVNRGLIALVKKRIDGYWHEEHRIMKKGNINA